ncbi:MAG: ribulose 1,5-bisphosphate carboxylase large subunit [bacterium]|nr:ribulose 1,5-bisphosphate carboxylase large subunit [bacterium]
MSGERFGVIYRLTGSREHAYATACDTCVEQTIEFPEDLVTGGDIRDHILGRVESFESSEPTGGVWEAAISYAVETAGLELTQFLNVVFGNSSLKPGMRVERLELPESFLKAFKGPRFGVRGIRELLGVWERPLFCTALKPMGLSSEVLAELAYGFALGGVDMIKDDHGLADQPFASFHERVRACAAAVVRANEETGGKCLYMPNVSASAGQIMEKARFAKESGAGALMVAPGLIGFDAVRRLADDDGIGLPIISHPALQGSFVTGGDSGISHYVLFGQLVRLAGADGSIFPNFGGRFSFSRGDCMSIVRGVSEPMSHVKPIFAAPGGGMSLERIPEMIESYGRDVIFLIGGALHRLGPDLVENCRRYMKSLKG